MAPHGAAGSRDLTDQAFMAAMEGCTLPNERFRHRDHVRLAWLFIREAGGPSRLAAATERMATALRRFALHHSRSLNKYHDTLTRAYMHFVAAHMAETPQIEGFDGFIDAHPQLLERQLPRAFYSEAILTSDAARTGWVEPDKRPMPRIDG